MFSLSSRVFDQNEITWFSWQNRNFGKIFFIIRVKSLFDSFKWTNASFCNIESYRFVSFQERKWMISGLINMANSVSRFIGRLSILNPDWIPFTKSSPDSSLNWIFSSLDDDTSNFDFFFGFTLVFGVFFLFWFSFVFFLFFYSFFRSSASSFSFKIFIQSWDVMTFDPKHTLVFLAGSTLWLWDEIVDSSNFSKVFREFWTCFWVLGTKDWLVSGAKFESYFRCCRLNNFQFWWFFHRSKDSLSNCSLGMISLLNGKMPAFLTISVSNFFHSSPISIVIRRFEIFWQPCCLNLLQRYLSHDDLIDLKTTRSSDCSKWLKWGGSKRIVMIFHSQFYSF